jgi:hypothetical protein
MERPNRGYHSLRFVRSVSFENDMRANTEREAVRSEQINEYHQLRREADQ